MLDPWIIEEIRRREEERRRIQDLPVLEIPSDGAYPANDSDGERWPDRERPGRNRPGENREQGEPGEPGEPGDDGPSRGVAIVDFRL